MATKNYDNSVDNKKRRMKINMETVYFRDSSACQATPNSIKKKKDLKITAGNNFSFLLMGREIKEAKMTYFGYKSCTSSGPKRHV